MFDRFKKGSAQRHGEPGAVAVADERTTADERIAAHRTTDDEQIAAHRTTADERIAADERPMTGERTTAHDRPLADDRTTADERFQRDEAVRERRLGPIVGDDTVSAMRARQRDRFGGISWGSTFFGLLSAVGLASIILAIVVAAGLAIGLSEVENATDEASAETIGIGGGIVLLAVLAIAWFCGGYVAGRMARFDGARQGVGVWAWTILLAGLAVILAAIGGSEYNVFERLNLPNVSVNDSTLTTGGIIALACALVVTLVAAILGGKVGERFHRRVDRFATREQVETI